MRICQQKIEKIYTKHGFSSKQFSKLANTSNLDNFKDVVYFLLCQNLTNNPEIVNFLKSIKQSIFISIIVKMSADIPNELKKKIYLNVAQIAPNLTELIFKNIYDSGSFISLKNRMHFSFNELKNFDLTQLSLTDLAYLLVDLAIDKKEFDDLPKQTVENSQPLNDLKTVVESIKPSVNFYVLNLISAIINNSHLENDLILTVFDILQYNKKEITDIYIQAYENSSFNFMEILVEQFSYLPKSLYIDYILNAKKDRSLATFVKYAKCLTEQTNKELLAVIKNNYKRSQVKQIKEVLTTEKIFDEETTQKYIDDFDFCQRIVDINTTKNKTEE